LDNLNFIANFDTGWYDPFQHELGISLAGMTIGQPYYEPASSEDEEEETEEEANPGEDVEETHEEEAEDTGDAMPQLNESSDDPVKRGCNTSGSPTAPLAMILFLLGFVSTRVRKT